jgi:hypothetical protein
LRWPCDGFSTWESRELPILECIAWAEAQGRTIDLSTVIAEAGIDRKSAETGAEALYDAGYLTGIKASSFDGYDLINIRLQERGRRAVGQWPSEDPFGSLIGYLESRIEVEEDPEAKTKLQRLLGAVLETGREVGTSVLTALLQRQMGL